MYTVGPSDNHAMRAMVTPMAMVIGERHRQTSTPITTRTSGRPRYELNSAELVERCCTSGEPAIDSGEKKKNVATSAEKNRAWNGAFGVCWGPRNWTHSGYARSTRANPVATAMPA